MEENQNYGITEGPFLKDVSHHSSHEASQLSQVEVAWGRDGTENLVLLHSVQVCIITDYIHLMFI